MIEKFCEWCDEKFLASQPSKIYCGPECRTKASHEKIVQRNISLKRRRRLAKQRFCAGGCGTLLSIYNDSQLCTACQINAKKYKGFLKELKDMAGEN